MESSERIKVNQYIAQEKGPQRQMVIQQNPNFQQVPSQQIFQQDVVQQNNDVNINQPQIYNNAQQTYALNQAYIYPQTYCQPVIVNPVVNPVPIQPNYVVVNQAVPLTTLSVGFSPLSRRCPFCGVKVVTKVVESFNCLTYTLYLLCCIILSLGILAGGCNGNCNCGCDCDCCRCDCDCCECRKCCYICCDRRRCCLYGASCCDECCHCRDSRCCHNCCDCNCNCCYDAVHFCPNCGKVIGKYDSCRDKFGCCCCFCWDC